MFFMSGIHYWRRRERNWGLCIFSCSSLQHRNSEISPSIGDSAFRLCSALATVTIGERVEIIGDEAFYSCSSLQSITIPSLIIQLDIIYLPYAEVSNSSKYPMEKYIILVTLMELLITKIFFSHLFIQLEFKFQHL